MTNTNITNLRKNLFDYIDLAVTYNDVISVNTKNGNAIILSEDDYRGLVETLNLSKNEIVRKEIIEGINTPIEDCIPASEVKW